MRTKIEFILTFVIAFFLLACSERPIEYYQKYEDAVACGAVKRGWIPAAVPPTATEIHEQHDPDTNEVWIRFTVPTSKKDRLTAGLQKLADDAIIKLKIRYPSKWWFDGLVQQSPANDAALNAEVYAVKDDGKRRAYMAFHRASDKVYYWSSGLVN